MPSSELPRRNSPTDVRMHGFVRRTSVEVAQAWVDEHSALIAESEVLPLAELSGRVLAEEIRATIDVPTFDRAMMDGYALRAEDTQGATPYNALPLIVIGESLPGRRFTKAISCGQCVRIMTGAPIPDGADAVLPAEKVQAAEGQEGSGDSQSILIQDAVPTGKHIGLRAEDVRSGDVILSAGRCLRPQDVGVLASLGTPSARVVRRPTVRRVISGNELQRAGDTPRADHVFDANGPMLAALIARDGGVTQSTGTTPDDPDALLRAMRGEDTKPAADVILISGGSSVGAEDHAAQLLAQRGELAIHGIAMRPSSPSGMGLLPTGDGQTSLVFLLPGNPVSCLCAYDFFAGRAIRALGGFPREWPYRPARHRLRRKLVSQVGRVDYARVRFAENTLPADTSSQRDDCEIEPLAIGGASVLTSTVRADGFVIIPADCEGYPEGAEVTMWQY